MTKKTTIPDFDSQWDLPRAPLKSAYIVCATPRTGSNLLCFSLAKQEIGTPIEYLNLLGNSSAQDFYSRITKGNFQSDLKSNMTGAEMCSKYIPEIVNHRTTANGTFGMKIFAHHFTNLFGKSGFSALTSLIGCEPKLIHLVRENLIELTISYIMARNNQSWHSEMTSDKSNKTIYSFEGFFEIMKDLNEIQNQWNSILGRQPHPNILRITYKDISENYIETMERVNAYLGVTGTKIPAPAIKRQASEEKLRLIERFTTDCRRNANSHRTDHRMCNTSPSRCVTSVQMFCSRC